METLNAQRYQHLTEGAEVLMRDRYGDKVLALRDGRILKLFRRKHLISKALLFPYAKRFCRHAQRIQALGVLTVAQCQALRIPSIERTAVVYLPLLGSNLRDLAEQSGWSTLPQSLTEELARFIASLHQRGIYFRSIHLGNIVRNEQGELGLIDLADMRVHRSALSTSKRLRNFHHLLRYREDYRLLDLANHDHFLNAYTDAAPEKQRAALAAGLKPLRQHYRPTPA